MGGRAPACVALQLCACGMGPPGPGEGGYVGRGGKSMGEVRTIHEPKPIQSNKVGESGFLVAFLEKKCHFNWFYVVEDEDEDDWSGGGCQIFHLRLNCLLEMPFFRAFWLDSNLELQAIKCSLAWLWNGPLYRRPCQYM